MATPAILKPNTSQKNISTLWSYLCHYALSDYQDIMHKRSAALDLLPIPSKTEEKEDSVNDYHEELNLKKRKQKLENPKKKKKPSPPKKRVAKNQQTERVLEPPIMRVEFQRAIQELGGEDIKWVDRKKIETSDVVKQQGRFYLPTFLDKYLYEHEIQYMTANAKNKILVSVIDDINYKAHEISLGYWQSIERYILVSGWTKFVTDMGIESTNDQKAEIWTFRIPQGYDKDGNEIPKKLGLVLNITGRCSEKNLNEEVCSEEEVFTRGRRF